MQIGIFRQIRRHTDNFRALFRQLHSAWPNGAERVSRRLPQEAIMADVVKRGFFSVIWLITALLQVCWHPARRVPFCHSSASTQIKWFLSHCSRKGTPLYQRVAQNDAWLVFRIASGVIKRRHQRRDTCHLRAAHTSRTRSIYLPALKARILCELPSPLLAVNVHQHDQVRQAMVRCRHSCFPVLILRQAHRPTWS
ncbi:DUF995 domain-containing protein [Enterobacter cloacae subsp. cloacae]|nr:DUF995 domain-containing protein [Enterobacter cloacae subsp. cloacae]